MRVQIPLLAPHSPTQHTKLSLAASRMPAILRDAVPIDVTHRELPSTQNSITGNTARLSLRQTCRVQFCAFGKIQDPSTRVCPTAIFVTLSSKLSIFDQKLCLEIAASRLNLWKLISSVPFPLVAYDLLLSAALREHLAMKKPETSIRLLTLAEAASILKISKRTLHRMIQNRQIPAFKVGGQWRILESRFQEWVQEEENTAPKAS